MTQLVIPVTDTDPQGRPRATFPSPSTRGKECAIDGFNIAVVATDDHDPRFARPVVIDPVIGNRNG